MRHVWMGCLICVLLLMGCDRSSSDPSKSGGAAEGSSKITIVASVQTEADMAQRLAGNWADVSWLVEAGRRPEQAEVDAENRQRAGRAAAVVIAGPWDTWALANLSADARTAHVVEPSRMPSARDADPNAYLWLDPPVMREMAGRLRGRLGVLDPKRDAALSARSRDHYQDHGFCGCPIGSRCLGWAGPVGPGTSAQQVRLEHHTPR